MEKKFRIFPRHLTKKAVVEIETFFGININDTNWDAFGITEIVIEDPEEDE